MQTQTNPAYDALIAAAGALLRDAGEGFRCGPGAELLDAYEAATTPAAPAHNGQ